eukprot:6080897-Pyramimonas_sp.AAC.1
MASDISRAAQAAKQLQHVEDHATHSEDVGAGRVEGKALCAGHSLPGWDARGGPQVAWWRRGLKQD